MAVEKAGQYVCLTTLEYAVRGPLMSTHCPSCGLRLIIKHDNLINRVTSVSLLLGMSMLIGYNLGTPDGLFHKLSNRILRLFGFGGDDENGTKGKRQNNCNNQKNRRQQYVSSEEGSSSVNGRVKTSEEMIIEEIDETQMSDLTCDSAIDVRYGSALQDDDLDEQLMELFSYNDLYSDFYGKNNQYDSSYEIQDDDESPQKRFRTRTVDRIDQVLHQIDDIKKSIVEIDDELYHIAGSTYANFNPNFLTLTNTFVDEFERDDDLFDSMSKDRKVSEDRTSLTKEEANHRSSDASTSAQLDHRKQKKRYSTPSDARFNSSKESHASFSDVDSLQLEWDFDFESDYDYYGNAQGDSQTDDMDKKQSPLKEKLSSAANGLELPMTDEQKLKNMHDLLDEAKKLGLLNNIIDALAPPSEPIQKDKFDHDQVDHSMKKRSKS